MKPSGEKLDPVDINLVHQTMLTGESTRPRAAQLKFERFRLAEAFKRIADYILNDQKQSQRKFTVIGDPVFQIFSKFGAKRRKAFRCPQGRLPAAVARR